MKEASTRTCCCDACSCECLLECMPGCVTGENALATASHDVTMLGARRKDLIDCHFHSSCLPRCPRAAYLHRLFSFSSCLPCCPRSPKPPCVFTMTLRHQQLSPLLPPSHMNYNELAAAPNLDSERPNAVSAVTEANETHASVHLAETGQVTKQGSD